MPANISPAFVLLTGNNYLARSANDAALSGVASLSVAVTFDPNLIAAAQTGTVISKYNSTTNQRSWRITYDSATGFVTVAVFLNGNGTGNNASRVSSVAVRVRSVICFTFDGAGTALNLYVNGTLRNGTLTGTVPASVYASTERLAIGAEGPSSGTGSQPFKGGVYHVAIWASVLSGAEVATILRDGVTPTALKTGHSLVANWEHTAITNVTLTALYSSWVDTVSTLALTGLAVSGALPYALGTTGTLLIVNKWDINLTDLAFGAQSLTSTYTLSAPYRLWFSGATTPSQASGWRSYKNDITIFLRSRKPVGTALATLFQFYGISLQYQLSSKELFCIVGDDTSNTLLNRKFSFGTNTAPLQGINADVVIRYNSLDDNIDVFIGDTKFTATITTTNSNTTTTNLLLADQSDFVFAAVVPACLSDARVHALIQAGFTTAYPMLSSVMESVGYFAEPYAEYAKPDASIPTAIVREEVLSNFTQISVLRNVPFNYVDAPYKIEEKQKTIYTDPNPQIVSLSADSSHLVTVSGQAGTTNAYLTLHWWEIELVSGSIYIVSSLELSTYFFATRYTKTQTFAIPTGQNWNGKRFRFVVQSAYDATQTWSSPWSTLSGANFDNSNSNLLNIPTYSDPAPAITSVIVDGSFNITLVGAIGPCTVTVVVLPGGVELAWFWEVEYISGKFYAIADETIQIFGTRQTVTTTFAIPSRISFENKVVRLVAVGKYDRTQYWKSSPFTMTGSGFNNSGDNVLHVPTYPNPSPAIISASVDGSFNVTLVGAIGPCVATGIPLPLGTELSWFWEIEYSAGELYTIADETIQIFGTRTTVTTVVAIPLGVSFQNKPVRLVAVGRYDRTQYFKSAPSTMLGDHYDHSGGNLLYVPIYADPSPVINAVAVDGNHRVTVSGQLGPFTSDLLATPELTYFWEIELQTGEIYTVVDESFPATFMTRRGVSTDFLIPVLISFKGHLIRLCARARYDYAQVWKSAPLTMFGDGYDNSTFFPRPFPEPPPLPPIADIDSNPGSGVYRRRERDFSTRR